MWRQILGGAAVLLPFVIAYLWERRASRRAFRRLPEPTREARRKVETQAVP